MNRLINRPHRFQILTRNNFLVCALALVCLLSLACGKRRPPLPPFENVPQTPPLISGAQRGNQVILSWLTPLRNAVGTSVQSIRRIDVYRIVERLDDPLPLTEQQFSARSNIIGSFDFDTLQQAAQEKQPTLTYVDTLAFGAEPVRLRYAIRYVNAANQRAAFSNFLLLEPASRIARPPLEISADTTETAVRLLWQPPAANVDDSTPINVLGYNIYRTSLNSNERVTKPLNAIPITTTDYADRNFRFGETYTYIVRTVSLGTQGRQVESLDSNPVSITPRDTFPPSAPASISIAAAPARLSLFFPANPEADVAGYLIYRSTNENLARELWTPLTPEPLNRTTFQDTAVESGTRYFYYIVAVDSFGNRSAPSEVASEIAP